MVLILGGMFFGFMMLASTVVAGGVIYGWDRYDNYAKGVVPPEQLLANLPGGGARVYDRNGTLLYQFIDELGGLRRPVPLSEISPWLREATIATEDRTFYENNGLNVRGLTRAALENFTPFAGEGVLEGTGGSSITQQLAKNVYIPREERYERTVSRKAREVVIALELTKRYSKDQILEWYMNSISYGGLYVGIEAAADGYFGKPAKDLTLAEAAMLAGIPQSPVAYDPLGNPEGAKWRQGEVLRFMVSHGAITQDQADAAGAETLVYRKNQRFDILAPHFVLGPVAAEIKARFGERALFDDGLEITTTLDMTAQRSAEAALEKHLALNEKVSGGHNGAVQVLDPRTGQILAYVGSRDYFRDDIEGRNDMTTALRSPGSTLKPFTYLTAFQKGWSPGTNILDAKTEIIDASTGKTFSPTNPNEKYNGLLTASASLGNSLNISAMKAIMFGGVPQTVSVLKQSGFTTLDDPRGYGPALTLGGADVTLGDATFAYSVLANGGVMRGQAAVRPHDTGERTLDPVILLSVHSSRGWSYTPEVPAEQRIVAESVTYLVTSIISDPKNTCIVWSCGALEVPGRPTAHKTGTSAPFETSKTDIGDTWSFGYTPDLVVGVWIGNADKQPMQNIYSTTIAWPLWRDVIDTVSKQWNLPPKPFVRPSTVAEATLCWPSGFVATALCPTAHRYKGLVATDSKPLQDTWWQRVATDGTLVSSVPSNASIASTEVRLFLPASETVLRNWLAVQNTGLLYVPGANTVAITSPAAQQRVSGTVAIMGRAAPPDAVSSTLEYRDLTGTWVPIQTTTGSVTGLLGMWDTTSLPPGEYTLRLTASDAKIGQLQATAGVTVGPATAGPTSGALISLSPNLSGSISTATFPITGFVVTKSLFDYLVEVGVGTAPTSWMALGQGKSEVMGGVLAQWDTTAFPEGAYTVRLTVREVTGKITHVLAYPTLKRAAP
jgi:membrane peptidoglycan carboxypeptidase